MLVKKGDKSRGVSGGVHRLKRMIDFDYYDVIVGYGIRQVYERTKYQLKDKVRIHYLADKNGKNRYKRV